MLERMQVPRLFLTDSDTYHIYELYPNYRCILGLRKDISSRNNDNPYTDHLDGEQFQSSDLSHMRV